MWKDTNFGAQIAELNKAGLNPGLIYGMGGAGGTTTGHGTAQPSGATAPGGTTAAEMGMGLQMGLMAAQKRLIEAQASNLEADTKNKPLVGENIQADTALKEIGWNIQAIEEDIKGSTANAAKAIIIHNARTTFEQMEQAVTQNKITQATAQTAIDKAAAELAGIYAKNELTRAQEEATKKGNEKTAQEIELIKQEVATFKTTLQFEQWAEKKRLELMNKGINMAVIASTLGAILNFAKPGKK